MPETTLYPHIESDPKTCGGLPCIAGTRIRVIDVVALHRQGDSPADILEAYPHLALGQVYAALAYYYDHREEVEDQFAEIDRRVEEFKREHPDLVH